LVGRSKRIGHAQVDAEFEYGVAEGAAARIRVEIAIAGCAIHEAVAVGGKAHAALPDAASGNVVGIGWRVGGRAERGEVGECGCVERHDPAVVLANVEIAMGAEGRIDDVVEQQQAGSVELPVW
jgi:hypothetical protein